MFTVIYRIVLVASIGVVLGGTGAVYSTKYDARAAAKRLGDLRHQISEEQEMISVLRAEWSLLNQPSRLEELSERFLELQPMTVEQVGGIKDLPMRPIHIPVPAMQPEGGLAHSGSTVE